MTTAHTLLRLDVSPRGTRSLSRMLSQHFVDLWLREQPASRVIERDLAQTPPPFVSAEWIAAAFTPSEERSAEITRHLDYSDACIRELRQADVYVVATPMYNYGMPAILKAWVDQVIRVGETFSFDLNRGDYPLEPILREKRLVVLGSRGEFGFGDGGERASMNHLDPHLKTLERYLGVERSWYLSIEYQEFRDSRHRDSIQRAMAQLPEIVSDVRRSLVPLTML